MKCNLDCSYCHSGLYGGHDNSQTHPPLDGCLNTIDFMYRYVDRHMQQRPSGLRYVNLNIYGGESLHHPNIVEILQQVHQRYQPYQDSWKLTVTTTTNAIVTPRILKDIIPLIDEFTVSYHTENTPKQKQQFLDNLLTIQAAGRRLKCVVLMHTEPELFADANAMINWLRQHSIRSLPRQLDDFSFKNQFYDQQQVQWFQNLYQAKTTRADVELPIKQGSLSNTGRACCGGRQLCADQDYKTRNAFVGNKFTDWYCSVDRFFVYIKQTTGEVFTNKDCKMNYQGSVGPIGHLDNPEPMLTGTTPVIQCQKAQCFCGLCAPKAQSLDTYNTIMRKYEIPNSNLLQETQRPN